MGFLQRFRLILALVALLAPGASTAAETLPPHRPGSVVVGLSEGARKLLAASGGRSLLEKRLGSGTRIAGVCLPLGILRFEVSTDEEILSACRRLELLSEIRFAEPDWLGEGGGFVPDDTEENEKAQVL